MSCKIKLLILSNQIIDTEGRGNPIIFNFIKSLDNDSRLDIQFQSIKTIKDILNCRKVVLEKDFDIIHIHFGGLNCFLSLLLIGNRALRIVTFHGTDIHGGGSLKETGFIKFIKNKINKYFSLISIKMIDLVGLVSKKLESNLPTKTNFFLDQLGVDDLVFNPEIYNQNESKIKIGLSIEKKYFLFSSISNSIIKRLDIANAIVNHLDNEVYEILMMNNVKSDDVPNYLSACNYILITSDKEGSPNIVREALLMNKTVFSVDCGDVMEQIKYSKSSIIISRNPDLASKQILKQIKYLENLKLNDREIYLDKLAWRNIKEKKINMYFNLLNKKNE